MRILLRNTYDSLMILPIRPNPAAQQRSTLIADILMQDSIDATSRRFPPPVRTGAVPAWSDPTRFEGFARTSQGGTEIPLIGHCSVVIACP
jgi:hypothetical protein